MKWLVLFTFMAVKMKFTKLNGSGNILLKLMKWVKVLSKNLDYIRVLNSTAIKLEENRLSSKN